jgi:DDE family transposase
MKLRGGSAGSSRGAASLITQAIRTARACGATGRVLVRADSAFGSGAVVSACRKADVNYSVTLQTNPKLRAAIDAIDETAWTSVRYPGAVQDPDTGGWISDAQVAETTYTAFESSSHKVTARLVVRRVMERNTAPPGQEELFPLWRHHAFLTDTTEPTVDADLTHRQHAVIEQVFADLIDGPWPTCRPAGSPPTPPGSPSPRWPTTFSAPPAASPDPATAPPEPPPSAGT